MSRHRTYAAVAGGLYVLRLGEQYQGNATSALVTVAHQTLGFSEGSRCSLLLDVEEGRALREHLRGWLTGRRGVHSLEHRAGVYGVDRLTVEPAPRRRLRVAIAHRERRTLEVVLTRAGAAEMIDGFDAWLTAARVVALPDRPDVEPDPVPVRPPEATSGTLAPCQPQGDLTIPLDISGCPTGEHAALCNHCGVPLERVPHGEHEWAYADADGATYVAAVKPPLHPQIAAEMLAFALPLEAVPFEEWDGKPTTPLLIERSDGTLMRRAKPSMTVKDVENYVARYYGWNIPWTGGGHDHRWGGCPPGAHPRVARTTPSCHGYPMHLQPQGWVCRVAATHRSLVVRRGLPWRDLLDYYGLPRDTTVIHDVIAQRGGANTTRRAS